jgi:predicted KAP-like P-loop ATPase
MTEPVSWTWMSDDPLGDPSADTRSKYFGRETFVESMSNVMRRAREQSPSSAFGLIGPWGSGKSTILASLTTDLLSGRNNSRPWQVREFNPWIFPDTIALQFGFFAELRQALPEDKQWSDTRQMLSTLRNVVSPIAKAGALFGIDGSPLVDALFDENRVSALQMREKVALHLEELQSPILFVLDDLDRLTAAELLEVFKLVRFTGRLPNVYYLLCYDEKTLVDMLDKTDLVGAVNDRRSLEYLEKIVQIRFDVPPLREDLVQELFELATEALLQKESIVPSQSERNRLRHVFESGFSDRLHTPRAVKHLMAQLEAFLPTVGIEVDWVDFVLLSWVRTFEPELYAHLQLEKSFLLGAGRAYEFDKKAAAANSWSAFMSPAPESHRLSPS